MKRVAHYIRVSHEEQVKHGISIDAQKNALETYSRENNYEVVKVYADEGISARKTYKKRPALLELISDCQQGKIDLILITKLDRFFRSVSDYYAVMDQIGNIPWKTIQEDYETETSSGIFKVNIMLSVAQSEADRMSERIKAVFDYKRAKGEALTGFASTGYVYIDGKWYKDKDKQKGVEAFFDTYLTTFNKKLAISKAKELGVHISDETARKMLYGDNYHGVIPYISESYITPEQHQLILDNKPKCTRQNKYTYIFTGLVRCGKCGRPLSAQTSIKTCKGNKKVLYPMYVCDYGRRNYGCEATAITEKNLESILLNTLESELENYRIQLNASKSIDNSDKVRKCKDRLNRVKTMFEMGDIDLDEYKSKRNSLLAEIDHYKSLESKEPITLNLGWKEAYEQLDTIHKNSFWKQIINYIEVPTKKATEVNIFFN